MGRYLKLLEGARAKRAKEGTTKGTTKATSQYNDTPLAVSVVGGQASNEAKLGQDFGRTYKSEERKKDNKINDPMTDTSHETSFSSRRTGLPYDINDKNDQSPFWAALVEFRDSCQNVALNHKYVMALADATIFLRDWGAQARALGWSAEDLFGIHPVAPLGRFDVMGLVWMLEGQRVVALTAEAATIKASIGSLLKFYRRDISHQWARRA